MVAVVACAIVALDVRHQVLNQVLAEDVAAKLRLWHSCCWWRRQEFRGIAIGQDHNHLLCLLVGN